MLFLHFREQHERELRHGVHLEVSLGDGVRCRGGGGSGLGAAVVEKDRAPPLLGGAIAEASSSPSSSSSPADEDVVVASPLAASSMTASFAADTAVTGESESGLFIDS